jgi:hypothetical protein
MITTLATELMKLMLTSRGQGQVIQAERSVLIADQTGRLVEVSQSQYNQMLSAGQVKPVGLMIEAGTVQPTVSVSSTPAPVQTTEQTRPTVAGQVTTQSQPIVTGSTAPKPVPPEPPKEQNFFTILGTYLEREPDEFVQELKDNIEAGVENSVVLLNFVRDLDYDQICQLVSPYKDNPEYTQYAYYIDKILSPEGKKWTETVLKLIREDKYLQSKK